ncbi:hypothetical protein [Aureivirga marina]|uniref:hypothetical protein n=1 Tax=Aureivirga marina TaxID=1182451 RepID=UPI0018CAC93D|nr:hypothetical protein [Aureivirga marina]
MKSILITFLILFTFNLSAQQIKEIRIDNNPKLTNVEADFLNNYLAHLNLNYDFTEKKVIFVKGNSGNIISDKTSFFNSVKEYKDQPVSVRILKLTEEEKLKSGDYDIIIGFWVKRITENRKRKIIEEISNEK